MMAGEGFAWFTAKAALNVNKGTGRKGERKGEVGRGGLRGGSSLENLHAMVTGVSHDHAPVAVDGDAAMRMVELPVA